MAGATVLNEFDLLGGNPSEAKAEVAEHGGGSISSFLHRKQIV